MRDGFGRLVAPEPSGFSHSQGQRRRSEHVRDMSAYPPIAAGEQTSRLVGSMPNADIVAAAIVAKATRSQSLQSNWRPSQHLTGISVVKPNNNHPEVQKIGNDREQRHFLAAVLRRRRSEGTSNLANSRHHASTTPLPDR